MISVHLAMQYITVFLTGITMLGLFVLLMHGSPVVRVSTFPASRVVGPFAGYQTREAREWQETQLLRAHLLQDDVDDDKNRWIEYTRITVCENGSHCSTRQTNVFYHPQYSPHVRVLALSQQPPHKHDALTRRNGPLMLYRYRQCPRLASKRDIIGSSLGTITREICEVATGKHEAWDALLDSRSSEARRAVIEVAVDRSSEDLYLLTHGMFKGAVAIVPRDVSEPVSILRLDAALSEPFVDNDNLLSRASVSMFASTDSVVSVVSWLSATDRWEAAVTQLPRIEFLAQTVPEIVQQSYMVGLEHGEIRERYAHSWQGWSTYSVKLYHITRGSLVSTADVAPFGAPLPWWMPLTAPVLLQTISAVLGNFDVARDCADASRAVVWLRHHCVVNPAEVAAIVAMKMTVADVAVRHGLEFVEFDGHNDSWKSLATAIRCRAKLVVGTHTADLVNALFAAPATSTGRRYTGLVELLYPEKQQQGRDVSARYMHAALALGMRYAAVAPDWRQDPLADEMLEKTVDTLLRQLEEDDAQPEV